MDLLSLRVFVAVAETGSIAAAAGRVNLVASAVSKRLAQLEASLGISLLDRHAKGVTLSPAGELLLVRARDILRHVDATVREVGRVPDDGGQIRLSANHSAMAQFLPEDLASWLVDRPQARVDLVERLSADVVRAVVDGLADVGIFCWPTVPAGLRIWPYRSDELAVAVPVGHRLVNDAAKPDRRAFADLADEVFIAYWPNLSVASAMPAFLERVEARVRLHVANFDATCRMVEAGLGLAILPLASVQNRARAGQLACVRLSDDWARRQLTIAVRGDGEPRRGLLAFVEHLVARADGLEATARLPAAVSPPAAASPSDIQRTPSHRRK